MSDEKSGLFDLWGNPWTPEPDPRGRKRHKRDQQIAENVSVLKAAGHTDEEIAARTLLSIPTLKKYYFRELEGGASLAQAVLTELMWGKAKEGNVGAARFLREQFSKGDLKAAEGRVRSREPKAPTMGLKAQRQAAAKEVGGLFKTPPAPKTVN